MPLGICESNIADPTIEGVLRILALDYGKKRIGLAVSDPLGFTAQGLETLQRTRLREDLAKLAAVAKEREVEMFLMGDPLRMSGEASRGSQAVREFAAKLEQVSGLPVSFWDERLTSVEANRVLRESGVSLEKRRAAVDRMAAVLLLQSYLEAQSA